MVKGIEKVLCCFTFLEIPKANAIQVLENEKHVGWVDRNRLPEILQITGIKKIGEKIKITKKKAKRNFFIKNS